MFAKTFKVCVCVQVSGLNMGLQNWTTILRRKIKPVQAEMHWGFLLDKKKDTQLLFVYLLL